MLQVFDTGCRRLSIQLLLLLIILQVKENFYNENSMYIIEQGHICKDLGFGLDNLIMYATVYLV